MAWPSEMTTPTKMPSALNGPTLVDTKQRQIVSKLVQVCWTQTESCMMLAQGTPTHEASAPSSQDCRVGKRGSLRSIDKQQQQQRRRFSRALCEKQVVWIVDSARRVLPDEISLGILSASFGEIPRGGRRSILRRSKMITDAPCSAPHSTLFKI